MSLCTECGTPFHPMQDCTTAASGRAARADRKSEAASLEAQVEELTKQVAELTAANIKIREQRADVAERLSKLSTRAANQVDALSGELAALQDDFSAVQADARKWRLFTGSARIRVLGSAGLSGDKNGYAHMGLDIWTTSETHPMVAHEKVRSLEMLDKYLEIAKLTQADQ